MWLNEDTVPEARSQGRYLYDEAHKVAHQVVIVTPAGFFPQISLPYVPIRTRGVTVHKIENRSWVFMWR